MRDWTDCGGCGLTAPRGEVVSCTVLSPDVLCGRECGARCAVPVTRELRSCCWLLRLLTLSPSDTLLLLTPDSPETRDVFIRLLETSRHSGRIASS